MADGKLVTPPVPDLSCVKGETVHEQSMLTHYYETTAARELSNWNKVNQGGSRGSPARPPALPNVRGKERTRAESPKARLFGWPLRWPFGRSTQVFDLPTRQFAFGRTDVQHTAFHFSSWRIELVKLYYIQPPRTRANLRSTRNGRQIHKKYLLETNFSARTAT